MWNLLAGYAGLVSIGQQAYIGIGAYALYWLAQTAGVDPFLAVPLAGLAGAVVAVPVATLAFRLRGGYFAIGTWVIAEALRLLVANTSQLGGGSGVTVTAVSAYDRQTRIYLTYWLAFAVGVGTVALVYLLLRIEADRAIRGSPTWAEVEADIFSEPFLLARPLLEAIRATDPVVLLIDEVDRVEVETEALLLEVLSDFQVSIPELGTVTGQRRPLIVLTSNATRDLSEALRRRCLYLHLDYPGLERERDIIRARVPDIDAVLAAQMAGVVRAIRQLELKKAPSISETLDWARTLVHLAADRLDEATIADTLHLLLKYERDIAKARSELPNLAARAR
jgi:MoxR-like ATPase